MTPNRLLKLAIFMLIWLQYHPTITADTPDLFFSEYIEGSSNNKALEIFNGTDEPVQLDAYHIQIFSNGNTDPWRTIELSGELAANEVYIVAHKEADPAILNRANQTSNSIAFNGNDAVVLRHHEQIIDVIGQIGHDPGSAWGEGETKTKDRTLRRQSMVHQGDIDGQDSFNPADEWDGFDKDNFDGLGWHGDDQDSINETEDRVEPTQTATPTNTASPTVETAMETATPIPGDDTITEEAIAEDVTTSEDPAITEDTTTVLGAVLINEIVTDPQQDWSSHHFDGTPGQESISQGVDEFIELYILIDNLDLTNWTIELLDGSDVIANLTEAFQTVHYLGTGTIANTHSGDYIILGNVQGSEAMNNEILIQLKDEMGQIIDAVQLGNNAAPDGTGRGGNASGITDEAVMRLPNGQDTNNDVDDFTVGPVTMGYANTENNLLATATITGSSTPIPEIEPTVTKTPTLTPTSAVEVIDYPQILISEFVYDATTASTEGDEFVELCNPNPIQVNLAQYKIGDAESSGGEGMYQLPDHLLEPNQCVVIAKNAAQFNQRFGILPDYEMIAKNSGYTDTLAVPNLSKYKAWATGNWQLANNGDEIVLLNPQDELIDSVAYRNGDYALLGLVEGASAPEPYSLQRVWPVDTDIMPHDFVKTLPDPGQPTEPPQPTKPIASVAVPDGMQVYWGSLHAHTSYSDGAGPPHYAIAKARAAGLHFYTISDHGWWLTETEWQHTLQQTQQATVPGQFVVLRAIEWTDNLAGHINIFNTNTLLNRNHPMFANLSDLYGWLANQPETIAQFNHPDPDYGGTFHNFAHHTGASTQLLLQEVGNSAQSYQTYESSFILSNLQGWKVAPTNNSDTHNAEWGNDTPTRTGIIAPALTETDLLAAMRARRIFATEDSNLALALQANDVWMGQTLPSDHTLLLNLFVQDADREPFQLYLFDRDIEIETAKVEHLPKEGTTWQTKITPRPGHFYWIKLVQADGDTAYSAPIWIDGQLEQELVYINEIMASPHNYDWDGDGLANYHDEWVELYNPAHYPVGVGGWQLTDASNINFTIPFETIIPAQGYKVFYKVDTKFSLNNKSDSLTLIATDGRVVDRYYYDTPTSYDETRCRFPDGASQWVDDCGPSPNGANWQQPDNQPLRQNIFDTKRLTPNAWVEVEGRVTAPPGVLGQRVMYIQDETAGILIYLPKNYPHMFNLGDRVAVQGNLRIYHHETEIVVGNSGYVDFIEAGPPLPPLPIHTTAMLEPYEGYLVMLIGQAVEFYGSATFWMDDGTDWAKVYIRRATGINKPFMEVGTQVTAVGIVSQYSSRDEASRQDYRLLPRYPTDLVILPPLITTTRSITPPTDTWPTLLPATGDEDVPTP